MIRRILIACLAIARCTLWEISAEETLNIQTKALKTVQIVCFPIKEKTSAILWASIMRSWSWQRKTEASRWRRSCCTVAEIKNMPKIVQQLFFRKLLI